MYSAQLVIISFLHKILHKIPVKNFVNPISGKNVVYTIYKGINDG